VSLEDSPTDKPGSELFFFYPANFWPHKNHEILLVAYQIYRHQAGSEAWDLVLTGSSDSRSDSIQQLAINLGIREHVIFKGHLPEKEFGRLFTKASALVFPSLYEGFGIPLVEAMRMGVPVLSSDIGSLREVVGDAALLVDPRKPLELAEAMRQVASSEELRTDLRTRGLKRAKAFSLEMEAGRLAAEFAKLASATKKRSWRERSGRRFQLLRMENAIRSRQAFERVYRFVRDRI
jgi:glycosyltransferase involved in cell wall biosynthesis